MLPQRHRLRNPRDFSAAVRRGTGSNRGLRIGTPLLVIHRSGRTRPEAEAPPRVGFVVSKAVGGAVVRNRVARRLRAIMAAQLEALPAGIDLVVRANPAAATATAEQLTAAVDTALAGILERTGS